MVLIPFIKSQQSFLLCVLCLFTLTALTGCQPPQPPQSQAQSQQSQPVEGIEVSLDDANFEQEVLLSDMPVLVDFGATWCGPCQHMEPIVATLSLDFEGRAKVGKIDVDESPKISNEYQVQGYPSFLIFKDGKEVGRLIGTQSYQTLAELLESFLDEDSGAAT